jgi:hypothetical protein
VDASAKHLGFINRWQKYWNLERSWYDGHYHHTAIAMTRFQNLTDVQWIKMICALTGIFRGTWDKKISFRLSSPSMFLGWKPRLQLSEY